MNEMPMHNLPAAAMATMVSLVLKKRRARYGRDADRNVPQEVRKGFADDDERMRKAIDKRERRMRRNLLNSGMPVTYEKDPWV